MSPTWPNAQVDGATKGHANDILLSQRFSDVPSILDIPVHLEPNDEAEDEADADAVEIYLENLSDPNELCFLLEIEHAAARHWMTVALAYAKQSKVDYAIETLIRGRSAIQENNSVVALSIVSCLCWMYLWKSRTAPRLAPESEPVSEAKTKEYYLQLAVSALNDASRINGSFPPLFLARGVLYLLKASLQAPSKLTGASGDPIDSGKADLLHAALKSFEDANRASRGKNMLAVMGKSRVLFSLEKYPEALAGYQEVLAKMPDFVDPDPRVGIGYCLWKLGFKENAKVVWERSLEINPKSKIATTLVGLYYLDASSSTPIQSPEFSRLYKTAITEYMQKSFKLDSIFPLTCVTFASHFLSMKYFSTVDTLANKAIQYTDLNAIASDGWYSLGQKEHYAGSLDRASDCYRRSDDARGSGDSNSGYLPAKEDGPAFSELRSQHLLGTLFAEEAFGGQGTAPKEDKIAQRAIRLLESIRATWKDHKSTHLPDTTVLLNLAHLYETEYPHKALQCLLHVEQLELDQFVESEDHIDVRESSETQTALRGALRQFSPPQLTNNIGCLYFQINDYEVAGEMFEAALRACMRLGEKVNDASTDADVDALITTISFNLGRAYEASGLTDKAIGVYELLLKRHDSYTDALTRLAYIKLCQSPEDEGPHSVAKLYEGNSADLEVRALYGWYMSKATSRRKLNNITEDPELRHYKHTLQNYDKHDQYALVGMGSIYLQSAREMRRRTDQEKQKRSAMYSKAIKFFEKVLQLDHQNAYAAQGIAIALIEDKKDLQNALLILHEVRDTIQDAYIYVNLGHIYSEMKQYSRAIESYKIALSKEKNESNNPTVLACLGRVWPKKGKADHDLNAFQMALEYSQKALKSASEQVYLKFNVAFVQIQLATSIYSLSETQRSLQQVQAAAKGIELAIVALDEIAVHPQCPYPKDDVDQRANMARNTLRKQLQRAIDSQKEYEEKNKERLQAAKESRQAELRRREEEREEVLEKERGRLARIRQDREETAIRDRELAEQRAVVAAAMTMDSDTGAQSKQKRRALKTKGQGVPENKSGKKSDADSEDGADEPAPKKRRLAKKASIKYKWAEIVAESDDGSDLQQTEMGLETKNSPRSDRGSVGEHNSDVGGGSDIPDEDEAAEAGSRYRPQKQSRRTRIVDESDEDE
ncbi:hypothetical protein IFR05_010991 [Cadophora sp. M221]|nr:hypothetical protein IFR05_010991 [Cadophora sp. M221]